ncbi:hypothetical protein nbrc107696_46010 [Gordonia spumicola]|uniref:Uncharacterized protein n=1 Tax=Gordonia spumicola TaxID=589161 RepID=A0A7I9VFP5_9ACTN|nr:hypothetical protein [Gordonia spumicola]GEE00226.1 hypothetical protein nbrc107696_06720 [Gordonia spumicola]GEE04155.1 hypothetical protein nbrc107696_46010 [Gordonia spumicola]
MTAVTAVTAPAIVSRRVGGTPLDVAKTTVTIHQQQGGLVDVTIDDPTHRDVTTRVTVRVDDLLAAIGDQQ